LSIVAGIVKGHKGFITVESAVGKGTTFHVYLPEIQGDQLLPAM
jgi:signal transduction histidine kinase